MKHNRSINLRYVCEVFIIKYFYELQIYHVSVWAMLNHIRPIINQPSEEEEN
jgi:hypothetical protein